MWICVISLDHDECAAELDNCHENASCNNTFGSFECTCNAGFEGDGVNCTSKAVDYELMVTLNENVTVLRMMFRGVL